MPSDTASRIFAAMLERQPEAGVVLPPQPLSPITPLGGAYTPQGMKKQVGDNLNNLASMIDETLSPLDRTVVQNVARVQTDGAILRSALSAPVTATIQELSGLRRQAIDGLMMPVMNGIGQVAETMAGFPDDLMGGPLSGIGSPAYANGDGVGQNVASPPGIGQFKNPQSPSGYSPSPSPTVPYTPGMPVPNPAEFYRQNPAGIQPGLYGSGLGVPSAYAPSQVGSASDAYGYGTSRSVIGASEGSQCTYISKLTELFPDASIFQVAPEQYYGYCQSLMRTDAPIRCAPYPSSIIPQNATVVFATYPGIAIPDRGVIDLTGCIPMAVIVNFGMNAGLKQPPYQPPYNPPVGTPIPTTPEQPPSGGDCIKICGWPPPSDGNERVPREDDDKCETCDGSLWFNVKTCGLRVFIVGCGPPRDELDDWIELGSTSDANTVRRKLDEYCRTGGEDNGTPRLPPIGPVGTPGIGSNRLCDFLNQAATSVAFDYPAVLTAVVASLSNAVVGSPLATLVPGLAQFLNAFARGLSDSHRQLTTGVTKVITDTASANGCDLQTYVPFMLERAVLGFATQWFGIPGDDLGEPAKQQSRFACPTGIPTAQEATAAWLSGTIGDDVWRCWVRANNQHESKYAKVADAARSKLSAVDLVSLRARGIISEQRFKERVRELGFIRDSDGDDIWNVSQWLPGPSDIVRFMVRDVADREVVTRFGLDDQFDAKFAGALKDYAKASNVSPDVMLDYWRAHWDIPSPTQLYEMFRRLRSRPELWPSGNPEADVRAALVQQDILPKWIDAFLALTFTPLTRVDTRRMFETGVIDKAEAVKTWKERGYSDENAERLAEFTDRNAGIRAASHPAVRKLAAGEYSTSEFNIIMERAGISGRHLAMAQERAVIERAAAKRKRCIAGVRKRYLTGAIQESDVAPTLIGLGLAAGIATDMAESFKCERQSKGREPAAAQLSGWYEEGLLSPDEFRQRLARIGYTADDAIRIARMAEIRIERKLANEEKRQIVAMAKRLKADQAERDKEVKALEKSLREGKSEIKRYQSLQRSRQKIIGDIALAMSQRTGESISDAKRSANTVFSILQSDGTATANETLLLMAESSESTAVETWADLERETRLLLTARIFPLPAPPIDIV